MKKQYVYGNVISFLLLVIGLILLITDAVRDGSTWSSMRISGMSICGLSLLVFIIVNIIRLIEMRREGYNVLIL